MPLLALLYFCTLVSLGFWAFSATDDPPTYDSLHTVSGTLHHKREVGGGKVNYYYAIYLDFDGKTKSYTLEHKLSHAYRRLKQGDRVELKVEDEGDSFIFELRANDRTLANYSQVVKARYNDDYTNIKWLAIVLSTLSLLTLVPLLIMYFRLSDQEMAELEASVEKKRKEKVRNRKYVSRI